MPDESVRPPEARHVSKKEKLLRDINWLYVRANESYEDSDGVEKLQKLISRGLAPLRVDVRDFRDEKVERNFEALEIYMKGLKELKVVCDCIKKVEECGGSPEYKHCNLEAGIREPLKKFEAYMDDSSLFGNRRRQLENLSKPVYSTAIIYLYELARLAKGGGEIYTLPNGLEKRRFQDTQLR